MIDNPDRLRRRLKLRDLDTFAAVVDAGGMRKAAGKLNLSQPAVSKAVAELEDILGVALLARDRRGVEITPCGQELLKRTANIFDQLHEVSRDLQHLSDPF